MWIRAWSVRGCSIHSVCCACAASFVRVELGAGGFGALSAVLTESATTLGPTPRLRKHPWTRQRSNKGNLQGSVSQGSWEKFSQRQGWPLGLAATCADNLSLTVLHDCSDAHPITVLTDVLGRPRNPLALHFHRLPEPQRFWMQRHQKRVNRSPRLKEGPAKRVSALK